VGHHLCGGRAAGEQDRGARADQLDGAGRDAVLGVEVAYGPLGDRVLVRLGGVHGHGAAVHPPQQAPFVHLVQVAPHRGGADAEHLGKFVDADGTVAAHMVEESAPALLAQHQ
jgi:hypothetical protein